VAVIPHRPALQRRQQALSPAKPSTTREFDALLEGDPAERSLALTRRVHTYLEAVGARPAGGPGSISTSPSAGEALEDSFASVTPATAWLALAVITGQLPVPSDVVRLVRAARLGEGVRELHRILVESWAQMVPEWPEVEILTGEIVVDLDHTSRNLFATGIQRVSREAASRWARNHDLVTTGWTKWYRALRRLTDAERSIALYGTSPAHGAGNGDRDETAPGDSSGQGPAVVVPWHCTLLVPELPAEHDRARRYQALAMYSGCTTGVVGHDCVPLTAAETCADGMALGFALYLSALARVSRVAAVSESSASEHRGWKGMLGGTGLPGPDIAAIPLAVQAPKSTEQDLAVAQGLLGLGSLPIVLAVGSHEPRKNQIALLTAAEVLWREELDFTLAIIGGNAWHSGPFEEAVRALQQSGRPLLVEAGLSDALVWAAYRVAHCTVFPSLHEGFGLPVAESLACGTPVITSRYGSMRERAAAGGAILVDPRDDLDVAAGLRRMLTEPGLRSRLAAEAAGIRERSWDDYAAETWAFLVEGRQPAS
jgi:hypothetical protein